MTARRVIGALVVLGAALSACGSGGTAARTPQPTASPTASPTILSPAQLHDRLLTVGDVGVAWKLGAAINPQDLAAFAQTPCVTAVEPAVASRLTAVTGTQFDPQDRSYKHVIELVATGEPAGLARDLDSLFAAVESCANTSSPGPAKTEVKDFAVPGLGDQRRAYAVLQTASPTSPTAIYARNAYVRVGSIAVMIGVADFQATTNGHSEISDDSVLSILQAAVSKLAT